MAPTTNNDNTNNNNNKDPLSSAETEETHTERCHRIGQTSLSKTHAFGKLILFGEHFVVYHAPALVGAVAAYTDCDVEIVENDNNNDSDDNGDNLTIVDLRPAVPNYKTKKAEEGQHAVQLVLNHLNVDTTKCAVKCTFGGTLCAVSGIGASAAQVVSLARALSYALKRPMTEDEINQAGYEGEKGYHGTPSGIDNTAATFGGVLRFQRTKGGGAPLFIKKKLKQGIRIVYASTGITASTTTVVGDVRTKKEADEAWFARLLAKYVELVAKAEKALDEGDWKQVGELMNENHTLCQELTVSCQELDDLVNCAREAGAWGAKMSGTGRGGLMLALTPDETLQDKVAEALQAKGAPQVWKTSLA